MSAAKRSLLTPRQQAEESAASLIGAALLRQYIDATRAPTPFQRKEAFKRYRKTAEAVEITMGLMGLDLGGWA